MSVEKVLSPLLIGVLSSGSVLRQAGFPENGWRRTGQGITVYPTSLLLEKGSEVYRVLWREGAATMVACVFEGERRGGSECFWVQEFCRRLGVHGPI